MTALPEPLFLACVTAAIKAPSMHNSQPWLFRSGPDGIEVFADPSRRLPAIDPTGRAMYISLGAAVLNIRVALTALGQLPETRLFPDPRAPRHIATVSAAGVHEVTPEEWELYEAIPRRHTNRDPFSDTHPAQADLDRLVAAAQAEGAVLHFTDRAEREQLLHLARVAEERQRSNPAYRAELRTWSTRDPYRDDGVPIETAGPWSSSGTVPIRDLTLDREVPERQVECFEQEPTVAILSTTGDEPLQWLQAGQALERVLLEITRLGLATSLFTQPLEDPELRASLSHDRQAVQATLRVGYGRSVPTSPRRPPEDVIVQTHRIPIRPSRLS